MNQLKPLCDLHIHTIASGHAFSTVDELASAAAEKGLKMIALTDHGPAMPDGAHMYHFWNLKAIPRELYGVRILKGAEVNILDFEASIDLPDDVLQSLDVVIAALHPFMSYDGSFEKKNTETLLKVIDNPRINILAHLGNPIFPIDYEKVIDKAVRRGVLIEINNSSKHTRAGSYENCVEVARLLNKKNAYVILSSDAHFKTNVGELNDALEIARSVGFDDERILNFQPDLLADLLTRKKRDNETR